MFWLQLSTEHEFAKIPIVEQLGVLCHHRLCEHCSHLGSDIDPSAADIMQFKMLFLTQLGLFLRKQGCMACANNGLITINIITTVH